MISKLNFTKDKLNIVIQEIANLNGYDSPLPYLNELLEGVKAFDDNWFTCSFFLNIHYLCKQNRESFRNERHREQITNWLKQSPIISNTNVFDTTWDKEKEHALRLDEVKAELEEAGLSVKMKALFQFIEFLYSNIANFNGYKEIINRLNYLDGQKSKLFPKDNITDKLNSKKIQGEIDELFHVISENIIQEIKSKVIELDICEWDTKNFTSSFYHNEISELKESITEGEIPIVMEYKLKYLQFRTETNCTYFQGLFFSDLDRTLKDLFDFFNTNSKSEFDQFITNPIKVNSMLEVAVITSNNSKSDISDNDFIKDQIKIKFVPQNESGYYEITKGKEKRNYILKDYYNLHLQNWEYYIDSLRDKEGKLKAIANAIFDLQKDKYQNSHPEIEQLIIKNIEQLQSIKAYIKSHDYTSSPFQTIVNEEVLHDLITHNNSIEIIEQIKVQYKGIKGKRLKILLLVFQDLGLLQKERIALQFYTRCKREFNWDIASYNAMNGHKFNDITDIDEFNGMKQFIESFTKTK